jgi:hypothetical protein
MRCYSCFHHAVDVNCSTCFADYFPVPDYRLPNTYYIPGSTKMIMRFSDAAAQAITTTRPWLAMISLDPRTWTSYSAGVISALDYWQCDPDVYPVTFTVLVVGMGTDPRAYMEEALLFGGTMGRDFYKVRMPFGPSYGENGTARLLKHSWYTYPAGTCGMFNSDMIALFDGTAPTYLPPQVDGTPTGDIYSQAEPTQFAG